MKNKLRFILKSGLYYKQLFWLSKSAVYNRERFQIKNRLYWRAYGILLRNLRTVIEDWKAFQSWFCIGISYLFPKFCQCVTQRQFDNFSSIRKIRSRCCWYVMMSDRAGSASFLTHYYSFESSENKYKFNIKTVATSTVPTVLNTASYLQFLKNWYLTTYVIVHL